jgi:hypothetical protein
MAFDGDMNMDSNCALSSGDEVYYHLTLCFALKDGFALFVIAASRNPQIPAVVHFQYACRVESKCIWLATVIFQYH